MNWARANSRPVRGKGVGGETTSTCIYRMKPRNHETLYMIMSEDSLKARTNGGHNDGAFFPLPATSTLREGAKEREKERERLPLQRYIRYNDTASPFGICSAQAQRRNSITSFLVPALQL